MKISIIVPTNNIIMINNFINYYNTLKNFKKISELIIIGNKEVKKIDGVKFIRYEKNFNIVPFAELRGIGMEASKDSDFFLFLDDDHTFNIKADKFLMNCYNFLNKHNECGLLQLEKINKEKDGFYIKRNAHIWTSRGLFIKNIGLNYSKYYNLTGACEDLLYGYETLNESYIPYEIYNSPISRGCDKPNNYKQFNDPSYNEKILDKNIIGFIRDKYNDEDWKFYGALRHLKYPISLRKLIKSRLSNLI